MAGFFFLGGGGEVCGYIFDMVFNFYLTVYLNSCDFIASTKKALRTVDFPGNARLHEGRLELTLDMF